MSGSVLDLFLQTAERYESRPCVQFKKRGKWKTLNWGQLRDQVVALSDSLKKLGIAPQDKIAIISTTRYEWTLTDLAILSLNAVTVPIYQSTLPAEIEYILNHCGAKVLFLEDTAQLKKIESIRAKLPKLEKIILFEKGGEFSFENLLNEGKKDLSSFEKRLKEILPSSLATIVYTSGTTGKPKGVALTHRNLVSEVEAMKDVFDASPDQVSLIFLPLAHIFARAIQFFHLSCGFTQAYAESIDKLLEDIKDVKPHFMASVPRIFEKIYTKVMTEVQNSNPFKKIIFNWGLSVGKSVSQSKQNQKTPALFTTLQHELAKKLVFAKLHERLGGRLSFFISGGAPLSAEIASFFHAADVLILEGYGLTETTAAVNCNLPGRYRFGTVGPIVKNTEVKIAEDGEILVKGDHVFSGYYQEPDATRESFTNDGYFKTGDIGEFDQDKFLRITDRKKDLIVTAAGKNIAPQYIENLLKTDPLISQVMVHGDRRKFLSALITLNTDELTKLAQQQNISVKDASTLLKSDQVYDLIRKRVEEKNKQLPSFETIKKFAILEKDFSIEGGELTPTLKVKRKVVTERYWDLLDSFYKEQ